MSNFVIFDFYFTIAKTVEHIHVWSPRGHLLKDGKTYIRIHPSELQQGGIGDDEKIDDESFKEFYTLDIKKCKIIKPIINYLKYYSDTQNIFILTARPQSVEKQVLSLLKQYNININHIDYNGLANSDVDAKIVWIKNKIQKYRYSNLILFEDNKKIIKNLLNNNEIKIKKELYHINNLPNKTIISYYEKT